MKNLTIDKSLVKKLVSSQFPQWKELPVEPVASSGWDNRTFHLGKSMLARLPSAADYELQVEKEHTWLPKLARSLPLPIPIPLEMGNPEYGYPWKWSIYRWLEGEPATTASINDLNELATDLANFLTALYKIETTGGPLPGLHNFYRGGSLSVYSADVHRAIVSLKDKINASAVVRTWEKALASSWEYPPVWVHGDISAGNLLMQEGKLSAVIDFGQLAVGDPACDLVINWTFFHGKSRKIFQEVLSLDKTIWSRARGWALWKALIVAAGFTNPNNAESKQCWQIIEDVIAE
ncbi:MAG: aminoglycoside phosphotransferase [Chlamydiae bacterium CG10_big_fil_rev_8_21_14_0_10_35_9]|nr:MAG: aminoglycoside phosphotransferase [Chlamydiae bacterium CG10_big_fil_rev_8_21_14_0_10_35_9]